MFSSPWSGWVPPLPRSRLSCPGTPLPISISLYRGPICQADRIFPLFSPRLVLDPPPWGRVVKYRPGAASEEDFDLVIDRDGAHFQTILLWLRTGELDGPLPDEERRVHRRGKGGGGCGRRGWCGGVGCWAIIASGRGRKCMYAQQETFPSPPFPPSFLQRVATQFLSGACLGLFLFVILLAFRPLLPSGLTIVPRPPRVWLTREAEWYRMDQLTLALDPPARARDADVPPRFTPWVLVAVLLSPRHLQICVFIFFAHFCMSLYFSDITILRESPPNASQ